MADRPYPKALPKETPAAHAAFRAWCAMPNRPRGIPVLVAAGVDSNSNLRRWRTKHAWDARAASWDAVQAGAQVPSEAPEPDISGIEDPIMAARAIAQADLLACVRRVKDLAASDDLKPHLKLAANLALMEVAGLTKLSRPKLDPADPLRSARVLAERVTDRMDLDALRALLGGLGDGAPAEG
jgi:hypothetical protein